MIRKIKALCLALVAVCAMSAVVAVGAQAAQFTASSYPASGEGGQTTEHVFTVQGQSVKCTIATFTGGLSAASSQITITPKYEGCTAFGFSSTIDMNSCDFLFTTDANSNTKGTVHIKCSKTGDSITVTAGTCTVHIPPQTPTTASVDYHNVSPGVLVTSTVSGIHSSVTDGFACPLSSSNETDTTGSYTGSTQFNGLKGVTLDVG